MSIIRQLAPIGRSHVIQIVLDYSDETVTATFLATPKDGVKIPESSKGPRPMQAGTTFPPRREK